MPVTTINLDDFLTQKDSGDVVTGADWNKLVSLFHAVNGNANALLNLMKSVDTNTANIAQVSQGAVPDGSIDYSKLSKLGGTTNKYVLTSDDTPATGVTYYTLENDKYIAHTDLTAFEPGVKYYTLETVATQPAIAGSDVIGDGVIQNFNLAPHTLLPSACSEFLLGGLLNDSATVYTNKGVSGTLPAGAVASTVEHTITLDKPHKTLLIINAHSISILTADTTKPNLFIGNSVISNSDGQLIQNGVTIKTLLGSNKSAGAITSYGSPGIFWPSGYYIVFSPTGLLNSANGSHLHLACCYYDYATKSIKIRINQLSNRADSYVAEGYSFGDLIIGL